MDELATGFELLFRAVKKEVACSDADKEPIDFVPFEIDPRALTLVAEMRKPFEVLAEGLVSENSRADGIRTTLSDKHS